LEIQGETSQGAKIEKQHKKREEEKSDKGRKGVKSLKKKEKYGARGPPHFESRKRPVEPLEGERFWEEKTARAR